MLAHRLQISEARTRTGGFEDGTHDDSEDEDTQDHHVSGMPASESQNVAMEDLPPSGRIPAVYAHDDEEANAMDFLSEENGGDTVKHCASVHPGLPTGTTAKFLRDTPHGWVLPYFGSNTDWKEEYMSKLKPEHPDHEGNTFEFCQVAFQILRPIVDVDTDEDYVGRCFNVRAPH